MAPSMKMTIFGMLRRVVWWKLIDVSEVLIDFILNLILPHDYTAQHHRRHSSSGSTVYSDECKTLPYPDSALRVNLLSETFKGLRGHSHHERAFCRQTRSPKHDIAVATRKCFRADFLRLFPKVEGKAQLQLIHSHKVIMRWT